MKDRLTLLDYLTLAVAAVQLAFAFHVGINGPTEAILPMQRGPEWQVNRWGTGMDFAVALGGMAFIGLIVCFGMGLGARRAEEQGDPSRARTLRYGQGLSLFVIAATGLLMVWVTLGDLSAEAGPAVSMGVLSLIFLGLGAFLGKVAPNPLVGVRTPWSYKSRLAWDRSNRLAGRLFCLIGLIGLMTAPVAIQPLGTFCLIGGVLVAAAWAAFESWRVWRADPDRQPF